MSKFKYVVTENDSGQQIKSIIRRNFNFSSKMMTKIKNNKLVFLNGEEMPGWIVPSVGDIIEIGMPEEEISIFPAEDIPVNVVYEDEDILLINKQQNVVVHPTKGQPDHTMANAITNYMENSGQRFKIHFVNRLDRDTTGLLLVAKNAYAQQELIAQMKKGKVRKIYEALCCEVIYTKGGTIDVPIGKLQEGRVERGGLAVEDGGFPSITHYKVLERFDFLSIQLGKTVTSGLGENGENLGIDKEDLRRVYAGINQEKMEKLLDSRRASYCDGMTLCEIELETGRTHQIRVHMGGINHHVVGDTLYGGILGNMDKEKDCFVPLLERQALHAKFLSFDHPLKGEHMEFEAPLPDNFQNLLEKLRTNNQLKGF